MVYPGGMAELVVRLMLRLPRDLHDAIYAMAHAEQRSLNGQIIYLLRRAIEGHTI